mgnify:CR=1 FL=1
MKTRPVIREGKVARVKVTSRTLCPCGKRAYTGRKTAAAKAREMSKLSGEPIEAYHCVRGGHCWHIGHPPGWRAAQREAMAS